MVSESGYSPIYEYQPLVDIDFMAYAAYRHTRVRGGELVLLIISHVLK